MISTGSSAGALTVDAARAVLRRLDLRLARRQRRAFHRAIVFLGQREDLLVVDVADDHHVGVVRHIPGVVPGLGVVGAHVLEVVHPADDRPAVGMGLEGVAIICSNRRDCGLSSVRRRRSSITTLISCANSLGRH